jgi:hypothetical protein
MSTFPEGHTQCRTRFNHVYAALEGHALIGTAVWRPPHAAVTGIRAQLRGLLTRWRLLALSPRVGTMLLQGFANLEATHPDAPHWYLFFIGNATRMEFAAGFGGSEPFVPVNRNRCPLARTRGVADFE